MLSHVLICYHLLPYIIIIYYRILSYIIILSSYIIIIYYHMLSYIIICYHLLSYVFICYHMFSFVIICVHLLSYIIIYHHIIPLCQYNSLYIYILYEVYPIPSPAHLSQRQSAVRSWAIGAKHCAASSRAVGPRCRGALGQGQGWPGPWDGWVKHIMPCPTS